MQSAHREWLQTGLFDALARHRRVLAPDARGHGGSARPTDPAAYADGAMAWDIVALADAAGLTAYDVAGYSLGAATAVEVAFEDSRVGRLFLGGLGDDRNPTAAYRSQARLVADDAPGAWFDPDACGADRQACAAWLAGARLPQLAGRPLERIGPVLLVNGEQDHDVAFARRFAASQGRTVPGDHGTALHHPRFAELLLAWAREGGQGKPRGAG